MCLPSYCTWQRFYAVVPVTVLLLLLTNKMQKCSANSTRGSQAVTHPSTNRDRRCLFSVIGREPVLSTWYGRWHIIQLSCNYINWLLLKILKWDSWRLENRLDSPYWRFIRLSYIQKAGLCNRNFRHPYTEFCDSFQGKLFSFKCSNLPKYCIDLCSTPFEQGEY